MGKLPVAGASRRVVPAVDAAAAVGVADIGVTVTEAGAAGGETPATRQTAVALPTVRTRNAGTLSGQLIAERTERTLRVAPTR